jgi:trigger factor
MKVAHDDVHGLEVDVTTIEAINTQLAELNQELFDKLFEQEMCYTLTN